MKNLIITLNLRTARQYENESTVVVYPSSREMLDLLKLFLRLNRCIRDMLSKTAWDGGEVDEFKKHRERIKQKIDELYQIVKEIEPKNRRGGKQ